MVRPAPRHQRRTVFGRNPAAYDRARLRYPARVFEILRERCGLGPGTAVLEIGPGTGIATRALLEHGADPLVLVEADHRMARYLARNLGASRPRIVANRFESARLPGASFDLAVAATSFHWIPARRGLRKVARLLRPGGWYAAWNNHHNPSRGHPFRRALDPLYRELFGETFPGGGARPGPVRAKDSRVAALRAIGAFDHIAREEIRWTVSRTSREVTELWGTFSEIATLAPPLRRRFLRELGRVVDTRFGGRVTFPVVTPIYTARRRGGGFPGRVARATPLDPRR